ncbi:MAG TPA: response regulator transcription factor [Acidimicrobiales bacterium]|nr:response regulator transcription factor [Acidimicrobiales bacterium]
MSETRPIRVLIADDHPIVRDGLRLVLDRRDDIDVVAEAADGREAVTRAIHLQPDVAVIDLAMPELDGVGVIKELKRAAPNCRCIVLTLYRDDDHLFDALEAGAVGFLVKGAASAEIELAVRGAAAGHVVLGKSVAGRVTRAATTGRRRIARQDFPGLTERDVALLDLIARGDDNAAIARALHLAPKTVRNQVSMLLDKLGARDRADAVRLAFTAEERRRNEADAEASPVPLESVEQLLPPERY